MHDQEKCIPATLSYAETRAAAHQLRAIAARLLALAQLLPLPPAPELEAVLEDATEQTLGRLPLLSLHIDLDSIVRDALLPAADALDEAADRETRYLGADHQMGHGSQRLPAPPLQELRPDRDGHPGQPHRLHAHRDGSGNADSVALSRGDVHRSAERITGHHRDTITRLLVLAGEKCEALLHRLLVDVEVEVDDV